MATIEYEGYVARIELDEDEKVLHGREPEKPFSGKFVLRVDPAVHRAIAVAADREAKSINKWAEETLARAAAS